MRMGMYIRFENCRFEIGGLAVGDSVTVAYKCCTCGHIPADTPYIEQYRTIPDRLMYPDRHTMKLLTEHDLTHAPKKLDQGAPTLEGKI